MRATAKAAKTAQTATTARTAAILLSVLSYLSVLSVPTYGQKPPRDKQEDLFLGLTQVNLGEKASREGEQKQFIATIELEKRRLTRRTLKSVYENAFDLYRKGDFEGARALTSTILAIDPQFEEAAFLRRASEQLQGTDTPKLSERKLAEDRFDRAMALYREGRVVEASNLWTEVVTLAPGNLKAKYWLKKANSEIAEEHYRKGRELYNQRRLRESIDQFYAALVRDPKLPRVEVTIAQVESEYRTEEANQHLQEALALHGKGDLDRAAEVLRRALEQAPGNPQAVSLYSMVRGEIVAKRVEEARRLSADRDYEGAIEMWNKAAAAGYDSTHASAQIARARDSLKRQAQEQKEAARVARAKRRQEEEDKKAAEKEAKAVEKEAKKTGMGMVPNIQGIPMGPAPGPGAASGAPTTSPAPGVAAAPPTPPAPTLADKKRSMNHYQQAMIHYQQQKLEDAYNEATLAVQADPGNADADSLKKRIEQQRNP